MDSWNQQKFMRLPKANVAFSLFNQIYIGDIFDSQLIHKIIAHEKAHINQKHAWDILWYEFLKIVLWFNPIIYFCKRDLTEIHEFLADEKVLQNQPKKPYIESLLNVAFGTQQISFINSFNNKNTLKTRIMMLSKSKSKPLSQLRYLIIVPLVGLMLTYTACTEDKDDKSQKKSTEQVLKEQLDTTKSTRADIIPFAAVEKAPRFKDSLDFNTEKDARAYFSDRLSKVVAKEFNVNVAKNIDSSDIVRINVQFMIDDSGQVKEIKARSINDTLENEAKRVIATLPTFIPAKRHNKTVRTTYTLPIILDLSH